MQWLTGVRVEERALRTAFGSRLEEKGTEGGWGRDRERERGGEGGRGGDGKIKLASSDITVLVQVGFQLNCQSHVLRRHT